MRPRQPSISRSQSPTPEDAVDTATITVNVNDINEAPTAIALSNASVAENAAGAVIGNLSTTDPDAGDSHGYTVDDARFEVVAGQLKLKATDSLNHESEPTVDVTVTSTDSGSLTTNQLFTITVTDVNEAPTAIALSNASVAENAAGAVIGNLSTTDPDAGDSHGYTVDDARFEVVAGQLKLKATDSLNHESEPTVDVTVTSTDSGSLTTNQLFTITVTDVNEAPTAIALSNASVAENAAGAVIGNLSTTDPDAGDSHGYTVDDARFEVVAGQLKLKATDSLNHESEPTVDVTVTSTDSGSLTTNQLFTITVTDVNEAPTAIALSNASVAENAAGAVIGNLSTTDPDAGDSHGYTVDDARFEVVAGQLKLKATDSLNHESEPTVDVTVTSTDSGSLTTNQLFTITVTDVNEAPTAIALSNASVAENAAGAVIGNLSTTDPDAGDSHGYTVDDARFEVVAGQLKLKATDSLNHESEPTVDVTVTSTDSGSLTTNQLFTITVTDVNEAPTAIALSNASVAENAAGAVIGNLSTTDPDAGDSHGYTVDDARFEVVAGQLKLKATDSLNHESEPTVDVTVTSTDSGSLTTNQLFTITVTDVNEAPTAIALSNASVAENAAGAVIGNLSTTDPDAGDSHGYTVDDARFEVVAGQLKLKATDSLNHESEPTVDVTVTSTDSGSLTTNQLFTITVTDVNEAPTAIALSNASVAENAAGAVIGNLSTTDSDAGDSHGYTVDDARFEVVAGQLKLKATDSLNHESEPTVDVTVTSTDSGSLTTNQLFTITVTDVNEAPTATNLTTTSAYNEGDASVAITDIVVSDVDTGETITATLTLADTSTGSLSANNGATYTAGTGVWTVTDTVANVNLALANLVFTPNLNNDVGHDHQRLDR